MQKLDLSFGIEFDELYSTDGIKKIHSIFLKYLKKQDSDLYTKFTALKEENSDILIETAKHLETFIAELFNIQKEVAELKQKHELDLPRKKPVKTNFSELVKTEQKTGDIDCLYSDITHERDGFELTDKGGTLEQALLEAKYCLYCYQRNIDSCSKGFPSKEGFKTNPLGVELTGCPLDQKISEMNLLKSEGLSIAALSMVTIDNPMTAATGHRICNDCSKACVYQKVTPVDIPMIESRTLNDVLELPWGFEIYSLLTRFNPLNINRPYPKDDTGKKVLVVGLGPAGYTLSHHLVNDGHTVVAIDGLKIEPLQTYRSPLEQKADPSPNPQADFTLPQGEGKSPLLTEPIYKIKDYFKSLNERVAGGFGGVAEYGITVRWNKNYLDVVRLLLERRANFKMFGGVRFGSNITIEDAWKLGFDHIALCMGAGKPNLIPLKNNVSRGMRTASDFLMALQLTGAGRKNSIANLQLRLPVIVIGGGLTAIDAATESLAYYPVQVGKFLSRYETLAEDIGEEEVRKMWNKEELEIANEFIEHAKAIRLEKELANKEGREANIIGLMNSWGGAKMIYRKKLVDAPSYRLNPHEVTKGLEEGIEIAPEYTPNGLELDEYGHIEAITVKKDGIQTTIPARMVLIAAGTQPNTMIAKETKGVFEFDGKYFKSV